MLAHPVPHSTFRSIVKKYVIQRLSESGLLSAHYVGEPPEVSEVTRDVSDLAEAMLDYIRHY